MGKATYIVLFLLGIFLFGAIVWQKSEIDVAMGQITVLKKDLSDARDDAAGWKKTADVKGRAVTAQAELAGACLKREAQAQTDHDSIADIMATANPQPIPPEQARQGVDDATRTRAVDMLNRPW